MKCRLVRVQHQDMLMAKTLQAIEKQIERLTAERDRLRANEIKAVVARIKEAIAHYGLTAQDLGFGKNGRPGRKASPLKGRKLAVKYADGRGNEWSGVGRRPKWFVDALKSGKAEADMRVK